METIEEILAKDPQRKLLNEMSAQRDVLEKQFAIMNGQVTMQKLFVDTHIAVLGKGTRKLFDATYNGKPAKIEIEDYLDGQNNATGVDRRDKARILVSDGMTDVVLSDLTLSRPRGQELWTAEIARYPENWKRTRGNPGLKWNKASDLFGEKANVGAVNGLLPEVISVAKTMSDVASKILPV